MTNRSAGRRLALQLSMLLVAVAILVWAALAIEQWLQPFPAPVRDVARSDPTSIQPDAARDAALKELNP